MSQVTRRDGKIIFTPEQQERFSVASPTTPESALLTADAFTDVAQKMVAAVTELDTIGTRDEALDMMRKQARATELALFAAEITTVCAPELAQRLNIARNV